MIRTQIQLEEQQWRALRALAVEQGVSLAELVRRAVDGLLQQAPASNDVERWERAMSVVGRFHSGVRDLSERHDDYLAEAYSQ